VIRSYSFPSIGCGSFEITNQWRGSSLFSRSLFLSFRLRMVQIYRELPNCLDPWEESAGRLPPPLPSPRVPPFSQSPRRWSLPERLVFFSGDLGGSSRKRMFSPPYSSGSALLSTTIRGSLDPESYNHDLGVLFIPRWNFRFSNPTPLSSRYSDYNA